MSHFKHLVLEDRITIQSDLHEGLSFKKIAAHISHDCTTVSSEIRNHLTIAASIMTTVRNVIFVTFASPQKILCANTVIRWHAPSLVLTTRRRFALSFQKLPMYVMAVTQLVDVLFKKSSTMPRKLSLIMNVLLAIPVLV